MGVFCYIIIIYTNSFKIDSPLSLILPINECKQITNAREVADHDRQSHQWGLSWDEKELCFCCGIYSGSY